MNTLALCIPAYNAAAYLPRLLNSAKAQAIPFDEILVYNDCSTDDTALVAQQFGAKVIQGDVNRGCSYGKNILAQNTTCNWIHFHDADDELLPNFTTLAHKWMNKTHCPDVVLFDYEYQDNVDNTLLAVIKFDNTALLKDPIAYAITNQINPFCGLYKKAAYLKVGGYDTDPLILYNEDKAFHIRLAKNGLSFAAESEVSIVNYRVYNSMSAANAYKCIKAQFYVLEKTAATHGTTYAFELARELWYNITMLAAHQDWEYVRKALRLAQKLGYSNSPEGTIIFKTLTKLFPFGTVWLREKLIRLFKPHLRNG
ncbi:MAG: glycosyltransferase family A protein [Bacteroidota bacterium]